MKSGETVGNKKTLPTLPGYDPGLGRFISRDPIGLAGGLNRYGYVGGNPVNFNDPSGLLPNKISNGATQAVNYFGSQIDSFINDPVAHIERNLNNQFDTMARAMLGDREALDQSINGMVGFGTITRVTGSIARAATKAESVAANTASDFYVTSSGTAIPATGYRAIGGPAVERAAAGDLMSQSGPTYITLNNLNGLSGSEAKNILQLKYEPSHFATFDTLQLVNDLNIPGGKWNTSLVPEPIINTFPEFGSGGASQAITTTPIRDYLLTPF